MRRAGKRLRGPVLGLALVWVAAGCVPRKEDPQLRAAGHVQHSQGALGQGDLRTAARELEAAVALDPQLATYVRLSQVQATLGEYQSALRSLDAADARFPGEYPLAVERGDIALGQGDLERAQEHYRRARDLAPEAADAVLRWAALQDTASGCVQADRFIRRVPTSERTAELALVQAELSKCIAEPLRWYELRREADELSRRHPGLAAVLARLYLAVEPPNLLAAERLLAVATAPEYASSALHVLHASTAADLGRFENAEASLQRAAEVERRRPVGALDPPEVKLLAARIDIVRGRAERAARSLPDLLPRLEKNERERARAYLGRALIESGNVEAGEAELQKVRPEEAGYALAQFYLVERQLAVGDSAGAEARLRALLSTRPRRPEVYARLADLLQKRGDNRATKSVLARGVVAAPKDPNLWFALGQFTLADDTVRAQDCFEQALTLDPLFLPALEALAKMKRASGEQQSAARLFEEALLLDADNAELNLELAQLYAEERTQLDRALLLAGRASRLAPDSARAEATLALVQMERGQPEIALTHVQAALAAAPDERVIHEHHGVVLRALGDEAGADEAFARAAALGGGEQQVAVTR